MGFSEVGVGSGAAPLRGMSRQSVDRPARTVTRLRAWPVQKPFAKQSLDFFVASPWMTPPEILAHQIQPRVEQVERRAERLGDG